MKKIAISVLIIGTLLTLMWVVNGCDFPMPKITQYTIQAKLDSDRTLVGHQLVLYTNNTDTTLQSVNFNLYPNAFGRNVKYKPIQGNDLGLALVDGESYGGITINNVSIDNKSVEHTIQGVDNNVLSVPIDLKPYCSVEIVMDWVLVLPRLKFRLGVTNNTINLGQWYPSVAVVADGTFVDNPYYYIGDPFVSDVADYNIELTVPFDYNIASSANFSHKLNLDLTRTYKSIGKSIREFAFVLSDKYKTVQSESDGVVVTYNYYSDDIPDASLDIAVKALTTFNQLFGKYPYSKLTVAQTEFVYGGMEYSGLVMVSDTLDRAKYNEAIVHEIAHQWWYGVVGSNQVQDPWMDESLAEYSTTLFFENHPEYKVTRKSRVGRSTTRLRVFVENYNYDTKSMVVSKSLPQFDSTAEYVAMVYYKGHLMWDSLRDTIGHDVLLHALRYYYQSNAMCIASRDSLVQALTMYATYDMSTWFGNWLEGKVILWM